MSVNFSKEQRNNNVTFNELNMLIDLWASEIQESQKEFSVQHEELNRLMFVICNCRDKLKTLYQRILIAKCLQDNINQNLNYIHIRQDDIERMVIKLETDFMSTCDCNMPMDIYRQNTYKAAESLHSAYLNFMEGIEELQTRTGQIKQKCCDTSNIEYIAQLLQHQLQHLENIEMKMHDMKQRLNQTEYYKHHVLASLHIKENTF